MKKVLFFLLLLTSVVRADFFQLDKDPAAALPADKLYPHGRIFPFTGFSPPDGLDLRRFGHSLAGPTYGGTEGMLKLAARPEISDMPLIWQLNVTYKGREMEGVKSFEELYKRNETINWAEMEKSMVQAVELGLKTAGDRIYIWAVTPEELRWWKNEEMEYLRRFAAVIRRLDKKQRMVWMYIPGHYGKTSLDRYTPTLDVLAQGYYPRHGKTELVWCRAHSENLRDAAADNPRKPMVGIVPGMYIQPTRQDAQAIRTWIRHDVFVPLIHGAKLVIIFSLAERRNFNAHGEYFFAYSDIAKKLTAPGGIGEVLLFGKVENDLRFTVTSGPAETAYTVTDRKTRKKVVKKVYPTLVWRDLRHSSGRYCLVASSNSRPVKAELSGLPQTAAAVYNAETGELLGKTSNGKFPLDFGGYEVKILQFKSAE